MALVLALGVASAQGALARGLALVIGNSGYDSLPALPAAGDVMPAADALAAAGYEVISARDADARDFARLLDRFAAASEGADSVAVIIAGHFAVSARDSLLLPVDSADAPGLPAAVRTGLPLSVLYPLLAAHPGRAVLVIGTGDKAGAAGPALRFGMALGDVPQGVTVFSGKADRAAWFAVNALARPGLELSRAAQELGGIFGAGYLPADYVFLPKSQGATPDPVPMPGPDPDAEAVFWEATRRADTIPAYEAYLRRYPNGPHAKEAAALAQEIRTEPNRPARLVEDALKLTRDQRREIQRALSLLGHDPKGIDGIFGPGSRSAISSWQLATAFDRTGYLTRDQITLLLRQAAQRASELEAQAEAQRQEEERRDRSYWNETGAVGDEAGLRAYLTRYPDGIFAAVAEERLHAIEAQNRARAEAQERQVWDRVRAQDTVVAYREYLKRYPKGLFAEEASARIKSIEESANAEAARAAGAAREEALGLNGATRLLVEQRLAQLKLDPGKVDGQFDEQTRRALRRYQSARGIPATGYLDEATVVRLLAESFNRFGR